MKFKTQLNLIRKTLIFVLTLVVGSSVMVSPSLTPIISAQDSQSDTKVTGQLTKIEDQKLTLDVDGKTETYTVPGNVLVQLNEQNTQLSEIKTGDQVTLSLNSNNEVVQVQAVTGEILDTIWWVAGIAILVLLLAILAFWLWKKSSKEHIKTTHATRVNS